MINLHKNNSPRARYEASYLSWIYFIIINMITGWIPRESHRKNIIEGFASLTVMVTVSAAALLMPIPLPILSLIVMIKKHRDFERQCGKTIVETHFGEIRHHTQCKSNPVECRCIRKGVYRYRLLKN